MKELRSLELRKLIQCEKCAVLGIKSNIEADHKSGRYDKDDLTINDYNNDDENLNILI